MIEKKLRYLHRQTEEHKGNALSDPRRDIETSNTNLFLRTMTKAEIVNEISRSTGLEKAAVLTTVESFMEVVKDAMAGGQNVYLRGFGSFIVKTRKEKTARNISKNTTIKIPEHKVPAFKPSRVFLDQVK